jgi:hypothetical protein
MDDDGWRDEGVGDCVILDNRAEVFKFKSGHDDGRDSTKCWPMD